MKAARELLGNSVTGVLVYCESRGDIEVKPAGGATKASWINGVSCRSRHIPKILHHLPKSSVSMFRFVRCCRWVKLPRTDEVLPNPDCVWVENIRPHQEWMCKSPLCFFELVCTEPTSGYCHSLHGLRCRRGIPTAREHVLIFFSRTSKTEYAV